MANVQEALRLHLNDLVFDGERPEDLPVCTYPPIKDVEIEVLGYGPDLPFKQSITKSADLVTQARGVLFDHLVSSGILRGQLRVCPTCRRIFLLKRREMDPSTSAMGSICSISFLVVVLLRPPSLLVVALLKNRQKFFAI